MVAVGVIRWVECEVSDPKFFSLSSGMLSIPLFWKVSNWFHEAFLAETCPVHLALMDEVVTCHPLLHQRVLEVRSSII